LQPAEVAMRLPEVAKEVAILWFFNGLDVIINRFTS